MLLPGQRFVLASISKHGVFTIFAPKSSEPSISTLGDVLCPPLLLLGLRIVNGDPVPIHLSQNRERNVFEPGCAMVLSSKARHGYSNMRPEDISIASTSQSEFNLVIFQDKTHYFKPIVHNVGDGPYIREVETMRQTAEANLNLRIPKLQALVATDVAKRLASVNGLIFAAIYPNHGKYRTRTRRGETRCPASSAGAMVQRHRGYGACSTPT